MVMLNSQTEYRCEILCDILHLKGAEALAHYGTDFYAGTPCLTVNQRGLGKAYYVATVPEDRFFDDFIGSICSDIGIKAPLETPAGVEVRQRHKADKTFTFILNHNEHAVQLELGQHHYLDLITDTLKAGNIELEAKGVLILSS